MKALRASAGAGLAALALTSCGGSAPPPPALARLPILPGALVAVQAQQCDKGHAAYCAIQLVLIDRAFTSNVDFLVAERHWLHAHGWTGARGDNTEESAADAPGHKLHLTYATANGDLDGWAFNWIKRRAAIIYALSNSVFDGTPALSLMLEAGSGTT